MSEPNKIFIRAAAESNVGNARGNNEDNVYFNGDFITPRNISRPFAIKTGEYFKALPLGAARYNAVRTETTGGSVLVRNEFDILPCNYINIRPGSAGEYASMLSWFTRFIDRWGKTDFIQKNMDGLTDKSIHADIKTTLRTHGGNRLYLQFHFIPVHDKQGQVIDYIGMCRDISEIKDLEEKLAAETLRAQEVEVVKNAFLHNMSFEIRTPLNTVVGFAELFQMEHSADDEVVFINEIKENSAKLLKLINDILFLSRLDAEMIEFNTRPTDFTMMAVQRCEAIWSNNQVPGVNYTVSSSFRKLMLDIDSSNIGIILDKIVTNAVQYTDKGSVLVHYDYLGDRLIVAVEDTGHGIPGSSLEHIFERFVTGASHGAGLGLSICQELIKRMQGTINLKSTEGKGTTVWFSVPCKALEIERT